jgi:hypothetical protein
MASPARVIQTEDRSFVRDMNSKALLNTDRAALERNRAVRARAREHTRMQTLIAQFDERCSMLESRLDSMTTMLQNAVNLLQQQQQQ